MLSQDRAPPPDRALRRPPQAELSPGNSEQSRQTTGPASCPSTQAALPTSPGL